MRASAFSTKRVAEQSFRQFAKANGIDMSQLFRARDTNALEPTVQGMLEQSGRVRRWDRRFDAGGGESGGFAGSSGGAGGVPAGVNPAVSGAGPAAVVCGCSGESAACAGATVVLVVPAGVNPAVSGLSGGAGSGGRLLGSIHRLQDSLDAGRLGHHTTTPPHRPPARRHLPRRRAPPDPSPGERPVAHGTSTDPVAAPAPDPTPVVQGTGFNPTPPPAVAPALSP